MVEEAVVLPEVRVVFCVLGLGVVHLNKSTNQSIELKTMVPVKKSCFLLLTPPLHPPSED